MENQIKPVEDIGIYDIKIVPYNNNKKEIEITFQVDMKKMYRIFHCEDIKYQLMILCKHRNIKGTEWNPIKSDNFERMSLNTVYAYYNLDDCNIYINIISDNQQNQFFFYNLSETLISKDIKKIIQQNNVNNNNKKRMTNIPNTKTQSHDKNIDNYNYDINVNNKEHISYSDLLKKFNELETKINTFIKANPNIHLLNDINQLKSYLDIITSQETKHIIHESVNNHDINIKKKYNELLDRLDEKLSLYEQQINELNQQITNICKTIHENQTQNNENIFNIKEELEINKTYAVNLKDRIEKSPGLDKPLTVLCKNFYEINIKSLKEFIENNKEISQDYLINNKYRKIIESMMGIPEIFDNFYPQNAMKNERQFIYNEIKEILNQLKKIELIIFGMNFDQFINNNIKIDNFSEFCSKAVKFAIKEQNIENNDNWKPVDPVNIISSKIQQHFQNAYLKYIEENNKIKNIQKLNDFDIKKILEEIIEYYIFPFIDTKIKDIEDFHMKIDEQRRRGIDEIYHIKDNIMNLCGIEKIHIDTNYTLFDDNLHEEYDKINDTSLNNGVITDESYEGYIINWSKKVLRKAGVTVNYCY